MGKTSEPYLKVVVESYRASSTSGLHGPIHIRPVAGQGYSTMLRVRCPKELSYKYPIGTKFIITAKLTDRGGGGEFLSTHHSWPYEVVDEKKILD
jgi:hypothetical protein